MKHSLSLLIFCTVLAASVDAKSHAQDDRTSKIDAARAEAFKAPVDQLVQKALARVAPRIVEVERPNFGGMPGLNTPLSGLTFATGANSAGDPGLCVASVIWVDFSNYSGSDAQPPLSTQAVYKVVGDLKPLPDMWNDKYGAQLSAKCAHAGRVIPTEERDFGQEQFFTAKMDGDIRVWFAVRALELGLANSRNHPENTQCKSFRPTAEFNRECRKELVSQVTLRLGRLLSVTMTNCNNGSRDCYLVSGEFLRSAIANSRSTWVMHLRTAIPNVTASGDVNGATDIEVGEGWAIFD